MYIKSGAWNLTGRAIAAWANVSAPAFCGDEPHFEKGKQTLLEKVNCLESVTLKGNAALFIDGFALITDIVKPENSRLWVALGTAT